MPRKISLILAAVLVGIVLVVMGAYAWTQRGTNDRVPNDVSAFGIALDGLSRSEVEATIQSYEDVLVGTPASFLIDGTEVAIDPASVGLDVPEAEIADAALAAGQRRSFLSGLGSWLGIFDAPVELEETIHFDAESIDLQFRAWETEVLGDLGPVGGVDFSNGTPTPDYGAPILQIDRSAAEEVLTAVLSRPERAVLTLQTVTLPSPITNELVDSAVQVAELVLAGPVTLTSLQPAASVTITPDQMLGVITSHTSLDPPQVEITFDEDSLDALFFPVRDQFPGAFQNAEFVVNDDDTVSIKPGMSGPKVSSSEAWQEILSAASTPDRSGRLPLEDGARPDITTEDLEALGVKHLVSRFTTYHDCCANRVVNIHLIADEIDGVIVEPGQQFGINDYVGERTAEKGYLPAGTIVNGEIVDTVGGGVSQFATTFYNAVFWGGYTDVIHKPHSYYFSRYPEGIEATINWPNVELAFRNDTEHAVLIKTTYTDTSITVSFYSDNQGTAVAGEQSGGTTKTWIAMEGEGIIVSGSVSDRYGFTSAQTQYLTDRSITPGDQRVVQGGGEGWSVTVTRTKTHSDGRQNEETWVARYLAEPRIVRIHPCSVPGSSEKCPVTTTVPATVPTTEVTTVTTTPTTEVTTPPTTAAPPTTTATTVGS